MQKFFISYLAIILFSSPVTAQNFEIDLLRRNVGSSKGKVKIERMMELANYYYQFNLDSAQTYAQQALTLANQLDANDWKCKSNLIISEVLLRKGDLVQSLKNASSSLLIAQNLKNEELKASSYLAIGRVYNYQGEYPKALKNYQQAMSIAEIQVDSVMISQILKNIGGVHFNVKDYNLALSYWQQSLSILEAIGDSVKIGSTLNNLGSTYNVMGKSSIAMDYFKRSLNLYSNNDCLSIYPLQNIAICYDQLDVYDSSNYYYQKASLLSGRCNEFVANIAVSIGLANVERKNGNYTRALAILDTARIKAERSQFIRELSIINSSISTIYEEIGNTELALKYYKLYHDLVDSVSSDDSANKITELEVQYGFEKLQKEQEIERLNDQRIIAKQKWLKNSFIAGFVVMLIVTWLIYSNLKKNRATNLKLKALNKEITEQQTERKIQSEQLKSLNEQLNDLNSDLESKILKRTEQLEQKNIELEGKNAKLAEYAFINAHKLRVPVANILGLVDILDDDNVNREDRNKVLENIKQSTKHLDEIVEEIQQKLVSEGLN